MAKESESLKLQWKEKCSVQIEPIAVKSDTAAQMLNVSRPKIYQLLEREDFHGAFKFGRCTLFSVAALREWVEKQCEEGSAK